MTELAVLDKKKNVIYRIYQEKEISYMYMLKNTRDIKPKNTC